MKKRLASLLLCTLLLCALAVSVYADTAWLVTYNKDGKMVDNFAEKTDEFNDTIRGMQPGDSRTFTVTLKNEHSAVTKWYMLNDVINSLETASNNSSTHGGAYTYLLTYTGPGGSLTLHDSSTVGGTSENIIAAREGLKSATTALRNYFYLDTLRSGQSGTVTLVITLDGETQGNDYQDTAADLNMRFAVETETTGSKTNVVSTGDDTNLTLAYVVMGVAGLLFLILAIGSVRRRKESQK